MESFPKTNITLFKRHKENKSKIGQERSSMQQPGYQCHRPTPWMQESVSMHKKPYQSQAFAHESSKVGGRGKREEGKRGQEADEKIVCRARWDESIDV